MSNSFSYKQKWLVGDEFGSAVHNHLLNVTSMSFPEFELKYRQQIKNNKNYSMRYFNSQGIEFKSFVMSLANSEAPGTFKKSDVGQPFEYFALHDRGLLIRAMNKLSMMGKALPAHLSATDRFISE